MITKTPNSSLIAACIGLITAQAAGAQEPSGVVAVPTVKVAAAEVLVPLTAQVFAELDVARLAKELTAPAEPARVRLVSLPVPTKRATQEE